jgi:hypothetical protein
MLYNKKLDLLELRISGYIAYAIIPSEKRFKMNIYTLRVRYLGLEALNQYRLYKESFKRVIFTSDVVFNEDTEIIKILNIKYIRTPP